MDKQIAYCGLACCVCSENTSCKGCRNDGCKDKDWCKNYNCCREKGLNGCWECIDFPCSGGMLDKLRIRTFARFVKEYGEEELVRCLMKNKESGHVYHYDGQIIGDYDKGQTEDEIKSIIRFGRLADEATINMINHYDSLIEENNDPARDPVPLQDYMNKWDGQGFIDAMALTGSESVLEIGVGTGRLALKTVPKCKEFFGIDISLKTINRAKENLSAYSNVNLICDDFLMHNFYRQFDIIYSSLTFMHIENKGMAINKAAKLLKPNGKLVLSISKCQDEYIDFGVRKIKIYSDDPDNICKYVTASRMRIEKQFETEFAIIFIIEPT